MTGEHDPRAGLAQGHYELLRQCQSEFRALGAHGLVEAIEAQCRRHLAITRRLSGGKFVPEGHVQMPTSFEEARGMWLIGERWIRDNAPERLLRDTAPKDGN